MEKQEFTEEFTVILRLDSDDLIIDGRSIINFFFKEDIFSYSMIGKLVFIDKIGVAEYGPLTGNEQIVLVYGNEENRQIVFDIIRVSRIAQSNITQPTRENAIEIDFADTTFESFVRRRFSRSWSEEEISRIVEHILEKWVGDPKISQWEENEERLDLCLPYFTPMEAMMWLSKRGRGKVSKMPGFVYYNSTENGFCGNWVSLDYLFSSNVYREPNTYVFESENLYYRNKILDWHIDGIDKFSLKNIKGGHRFGYDFERKKLLNQRYGYDETIKKVTMLGKKTLYSDVTDYRSLYNFEGETSLIDLDNIYYSDWIKRYSLQQALTIIVRGFEDRFAGMHVDIEWMSSDTSQKFNKMWKKKWLIKSITHTFNMRSNIPYKQKIVLLKNAYQDVDQKELLKSSRRNI